MACPSGARSIATWCPIPGEERRTPGLGSIIVVVATDAPLIPSQCKRLAQRATVGLARVGSVGHNGSGDIFIAFATGNHLPDRATAADRAADAAAPSHE